SGTHRVFQVWEAIQNNQPWQIAFPQVEEVSSVLGANQTAQDTAYLALKQQSQADMLVDYVQAQVDNGIGLSILYEFKDQASNSTD
ncbi:hypothetical protein, partial [Streptomyces turgidiscabies]|uniref:hypothetical protein n=1 Tax=Streptomyces turgidiscabies TaxID=85558 RepID=UPI0038F68727